MKYGRLAFLLVVAAFLIPIIVGAFGVSPPAINADKLLRGSRFEATVFLVRSDSQSPTSIQAEFRVPDKIKSWFSLDTGLSFTIPAGVSQFPVKVIVSVPDNADLGIYNGSVVFNTLPVQSEKGENQVVITVAAGVSLSITVGENVFSDYKINLVEILDIKEGEAPKIAVTMENLGNVPVSAERATFDLFDKFGNTRLGFAQTEVLPEVPPFKTERFIVEFPLDLKLGIGEYWAEAKVYKGGAVVGEVKTVFDVLEKKFNFLLWGLATFGLIVVSSSFIFSLRRRSEKKR